MLTIAEDFALGQALTEWPECMTYDAVLSGIESNHPDIIIWEQFEDDLPADIVETIENTRTVFLHSVQCMTAALRGAIAVGSPSIIAEELAAFENQLGITSC